MPSDHRQLRLIFGGSFDPIHEGHLAVIAHLQQQCPDAVIHIMPNHHSPGKKKQLAASHRLEMIKSGLTTLPQLKVLIDETELKRPAPSYTIDTLKYLRSRYPTDTLAWVMGDDVVNTFHQHHWDGWQKLLSEGHLYIMMRLGLQMTTDVQQFIEPRVVHSANDLFSTTMGSVVIDTTFTPVEISATSIRQKLESMPVESISGLALPCKKYIRAHQLYGCEHFPNTPD